MGRRWPVYVLLAAAMGGLGVLCGSVLGSSEGRPLRIVGPDLDDRTWSEALRAEGLPSRIVGRRPACPA